MIFGDRKRAVNIDGGNVILGEDALEIVDSYKYLGHVIEENLSDVKDIELRLSKFYATANSILRNFKQTNIDTLLLLFNSYCKPVYGLNLWCNKSSLNSGKFKAFEVAYMKTLKIILGVPMYSSNHEIAGKCELLLLRHHIALLQSKYYHSLCSSRCFWSK